MKKLYYLGYLTAHSVNANLSDLNALVQKTSSPLNKYESSLRVINLINNIKVHTTYHPYNKCIQTCVSFSNNFNRNFLQENLLRDDKNYLMQKKRQWLYVQDELKKYLKLEDTLDLAQLKYIAGVDISFHKENLSVACAGIVIYEVTDFGSSKKMKCIYKHCHYARLNAPFINSFLVFREYNCFNELFSLVPKAIFPQLVVFNGEGRFYERKFGMACQIGVLQDFISIGVSTTYSYSSQKEFNTSPIFKEDSDILKFMFEKNMKKFEYLPIKSSKNETLANIYLNSEDKNVPLFVSIGHKITNERALEFLKYLSTLQKTLDHTDIYKKESPVPILIHHADSITRTAINEIDENELLFTS